MRIFIHRPYLNVSDSPDIGVRAAQEILIESAVTSVRPDSIISGQAVVLVADCDIEKALATLREAGMRAVLEPD
jgi:hypothetical protein